VRSTSNTLIASGTDMIFTHDEASVDAGSVAVNIEVSADLVNWGAWSM
jgi:hypothetical protein